MLDIVEIRTPGQVPLHANFLFSEAVRLLYVAANLGDPPGSFPTAEQLENDPIGCIRDFTVATKAGTIGGLNPATGANWVQSRAWARGVQLRERAAGKRLQIQVPGLTLERVASGR